MLQYEEMSENQASWVYGDNIKESLSMGNYQRLINKRIMDQICDFKTVSGNNNI